MKDGLYRLRYQTATLNATGVVVLEAGQISGCDRYYFMVGSYHHDGSRITGKVGFSRHSSRHGLLSIIPKTFDLVFDGVASDNFGQFNVHCPALPLIRGSAKFTWLAELNAKDCEPSD
jgi:hypothetical protein